MTTIQRGRYSKYLKYITVSIDIFGLFVLSYLVLDKLNINLKIFFPYLFFGWLSSTLFIGFYNVYRFTTPVEIISKILKQFALFSLFDYDVKDTLLKYGREIPWVGQYLPVPANDSSSMANSENGEGSATRKVDEFGVDYTKEIRGLNDKIATQESELKKAITDIQTKNQLIKELQATLETKDEQLKAKALTDKEYFVNDWCNQLYCTPTLGKTISNDSGIYNAFMVCFVMEYVICVKR
jgi:hypothetical protein